MAIENYAGGYGQSYVPQYTSRTASQQRFCGNNTHSETVAPETHEGAGSGIGAVGYTLLGGGAGAVAGYYLMGNPISEGENGLKVNERFYKAYDTAIIEGEISKAIKTAEVEALQASGIASHEELNALKKLAAAESLESLPEEVKNALPKEVTTPDQAKNLVTKAEGELTKIDKSTIAKATKESYERTYYTITEHLKYSQNYEKAGNELAKLADDIKPNELKEFITKNKELFNLKGEEAAVTAEIEYLSNLGKDELIKYVDNEKWYHSNGLLETDRTILSNVSKESKSLIADAPETLKNAFKNFKWSQAKQFGLWGAATAFGAYALASLFGVGSSNNKA